ncbi:MAG: pyridoxamine 5'-phosphate oxidase [Micrococcales bacterium]|nr:pyridoxamine 5'-phosphate oxidase [Micrococcales bacterium]
MSELRRWEYDGTGLEGEVPAAPWTLVRGWVDAARAAAAQGLVHEPDAMAVATVDASGLPDVRVVLMRFFDPRGLGFVSSTRSRKAEQIEATGVMAATLAWTVLHRAIRLRGRVELVDPSITAAYWATRPWGSRISAWASHQSHPVTSREDLRSVTLQYAQQWPDTGSPDDVPVPADWVGYRLRASEVELWAGRPDRLHDRVRYTCHEPNDLDVEGCWERVRLQP